MEKREHPLNDLMGSTMEKVKAMADVNAIVGDPIQASKNQKPDSNNAFGGGSGAGVNIIPIAFLVVRGENVRLLPVMPPPGGAVDRVVDMVPELVDKITDFVEKQKEKKDTQDF